jgi:LAO/AO transport system kinase
LLKFTNLHKSFVAGDFKAVARMISYVENEVDGYMDYLNQAQPVKSATILGITGPPGAGKSTLTDALIAKLVANNKTVAVLCIDPSSPFNLGAVLGDRIRMSDWYNNPQVYIRSLANRGALGGLNPKTIEIVELLKCTVFDYIIVETVGVGQSEIEIAGLADITCVVLVPEAGDEVQTMKAGLMEIADIFIVNKADRPEADVFVKNLMQMLSPVFSASHKNVPILKTVAHRQEGVDALYNSITTLAETPYYNTKKPWLYAEKAFQLIMNRRMADVSKKQLFEQIDALMVKNEFNLFNFVSKHLK